nr:uncharacterized protein LOC111512051 [Leptinotarsa decemlineata]
MISSPLILNRFFSFSVITTKVKGHEHCNPEQLMECAKPLTVFDGLTSFISSKSDLEKVCPNLKEAIKCIHTYTRHCMNKEEKQAFRELFNGTGKMVHELCREGVYQEEYLRHAPCMSQVAGESEVCFRSYTKAMQKIQSDSPPEIKISELSIDTVLRKKRRHAADEGIKNVCCAFQEFIECSTHAVRRRCGDESAKFSHKFFNKMSATMLQLHCSNYGRRECGMMSSSVSLQNSVFVILALSFFQLLVR